MKRLSDWLLGEQRSAKDSPPEKHLGNPLEKGAQGRSKGGRVEKGGGKERKHGKEGMYYLQEGIVTADRGKEGSARDLLESEDAETENVNSER